MQTDAGDLLVFSVCGLGGNKLPMLFLASSDAAATKMGSALLRCASVAPLGCLWVEPKLGRTVDATNWASDFFFSLVASQKYLTA